MDFGRTKHISALLGVLLASFFLLSYFGTMTMAMRMSPDGAMAPGCPFMPGQTVLCHMNPLEHASLWQSMFTATLNQESVALILSMLLSLALLVFFARSNGSDAPPKAPVLSPLFSYYKRYVPIPNPLQEAFSNGILHPKLF